MCVPIDHALLKLQTTVQGLQQLVGKVSGYPQLITALASAVSSLQCTIRKEWEVA